MQPVLAVYAGYSMHQQTRHARPGSRPYVQDALDEIEYVTGDTNTTWGAQRAKDGHPAPFPLTYVEIGNEDWFDRSGSYNGRFTQFYDAIKAKYPKLQIIATTPVKESRAGPGGRTLLPFAGGNGGARATITTTAAAPTGPKFSSVNGPPASARPRPTWRARSATPRG